MERATPASGAETVTLTYFAGFLYRVDTVQSCPK
jgi:hypothetical protein